MIAKIKKNKRISLIIVMLITSIALVFTGIIAAYFSDMFSQTGTTETATLKISGQHYFYLNGSTVENDDIGFINPGDVINIKSEVYNNGSQSAWIREFVDFSGTDAALLPYLKVYNGSYQRHEIIDGTATDKLITLQGTKAGGTTVVLNAINDVVTGSDFTYVNDVAYMLNITIYFDIAAGNDAQSKALNFVTTTQALQFKNNNLSEPNEDAWATVTSATVA